MKPDPMIPPDSPLVRPFLAALPASESLAAAEADVRQSAAAVASLHRRARGIHERAAQIAREFSDATGRKRDSLLAEHGSLESERAMMPALAEAAGQRYVAAVITWARELRSEAARAQEEAFEQMRPLVHAARAAAKIVDRFGPFAETTARQNPEQLGEANARLAEIHTKQRPLQESTEQARNAISGVDLAMEQLFGPQNPERQPAVSIDQGRREQVIRGIVTTVERAAA